MSEENKGTDLGLNEQQPDGDNRCRLCHKILISEADKLELYGEIVCYECWDENMYIALQDGGGV